MPKIEKRQNLAIRKRAVKEKPRSFAGFILQISLETPVTTACLLKKNKHNPQISGALSPTIPIFTVS
ncbi:hypothetical protein, partial [Flagellimonas flava]|uniref:hypothetical protein n=1 Tax=Flagellimonas flava TaxID=570519 RepID=UPI003D64EBA2